jgi:hypothetical protein
MNDLLILILLLFSKHFIVDFPYKQNFNIVIKERMGILAAFYTLVFMGLALLFVFTGMRR